MIKVGNPRAQASIEFLILFACFLSAFLLLLPSIKKAYLVSLYTVDVKNAEALSLRIINSAHKLSLLEEGSTNTLEFHALNEWLLSANNKKVFLTVSSQDLNKSVTLEKDSLVEISLPESLYPRGRHAIALNKRNNLVLVEDG